MSAPPPEIFAGYPRRVEQRFRRFHEDNPHLFEHFCELARKMRATGRERYSARTIVEVMRWDKDLSTTGGAFKINGDFVPLLARWLVYLEPAFSGFFELRRVRSSGRTSKEQRKRTSKKERHKAPPISPQLYLL